MTNRTWWTHNASHPSERDLLLYVNGEGGAKLARRVRDHIEGCWSCSLKRDRLAGAIAAFMRERETGLGAEDVSETADRRFQSRLRRLAQAESTCAASRPSPGRHPLGSPLQSILALGLVVAIVALFWLRFSSVPSVSAREILHRTEQAEAGRIAALNEPVVHQQFRVTRRANGQSPQSTYLEIWRDPKNNRWRQETQEAAAVAGVTSRNLGSKSGSRKETGADHLLIKELQDVLKSNDMHQNPISASGFAGWRSKLKNPVESINETLLENGDKALTITTAAAGPVSKNLITKAELVVRRQDWHPVEQRLNISEPDGFRSYDIRETSFEVVTLGSLGASVFEQTVLPSPLALQTSSPDRTLSRSPVDALELEMTLVHLLHQAGACLGEEVHIVEGAAGKLLELRGVVGSSERKQELIRLFAEFPDVPVSLQVPGAGDAAASAAGAETVEVPAAAQTETQGDHGPSLMRDHLMAHFALLDLPREAQRARMVEFSNLVITQSQSAHGHAWALRRLFERFNKMPLEMLPPLALARLQSMAQDHFRELSIQVRRCDEMLRPILGSLGSPENPVGGIVAGSAPDERSLPSRSMRVFESVINADRLIHGLFAGTDLTADLQESSSALLVGLTKILGDIRVAESQLSSLVSVLVPQVVSPQSVQATRKD